MSERGLRGFLESLRSLLTGRRPPPGPSTGRARTSGTAVPGPGAGASLPSSWQTAPRPSAQVRWKKDFWGIAPGPRTAARQRTIQRQLILAGLAFVTVAAVGLASLMRGFGDRTLPPAVRGVWQTAAPRYAERLFELSGPRLAFQVSDSSAAIHQVTRVREEEGEAGTVYRVEYREDGAVYEFSFLYYAGPPEEIRFVHQPYMIWSRVSDRRHLMQGMND